MNDRSLPLSLQYLMLHPSFPAHEGEVTAGEFDSGAMSEFIHSLRAHFRKSPEAENRRYPSILFATISGECFVAVRGPRNHFQTNLGSNLRLEGTHEGRPFTFIAPRFCCRRESGFTDNEEWVLFEPINEPAVLTYQACDKAVAARCLQLNFTVSEDPDRQARPLSVQAGGREVCFESVAHSRDILHLLQSGGLSSAPTSVIRFPLHDGESEQQTTELAWNIASFCGLAARQLTPPVRLDWVTDRNEPVRVEFYSPIRATFRKANRSLLPGLHFCRGGLADFFHQCFDSFVALHRDPSWLTVFNLAWTYDDGVFLENRIAAVMAAVELLLRVSLEEEQGRIQSKLLERKEPPKLGELIGAAKGHLRWSIPKHYVRLDLHLQTRNAAVHARSLPCSPREALDQLQKWGLFLYRRILMRLGYTGQVWAAGKGFSMLTQVDDFSEEANDFTPRDDL
jgi:hypothetical protein